MGIPVFSSLPVTAAVEFFAQISNKDGRVYEIYANQRGSANGQAPLYLAADTGNKACIRLLLEAPGIDLWDDTAHSAANNGHKTC